MSYPEIYPILSNDTCEIICVDHQYYARYTSEDAEWNFRVVFHPLFLDKYEKVPFTRENVSKLSGLFDMEDGISTSPSERIASGCYYTRLGNVMRLGPEAGEFMRFHVSGDLLDADRRYQVEKYWWDVQWEIDDATHPNTAIAYGWDESAVVPEGFPPMPKPHFNIISMEEVQYLAMNAKKVRGRIWPKVRAAMDTTKEAPGEWSIKPFVDEAVAEFAAEHSQNAVTFTDLCGFEWKEDEKTLNFTATDSQGESHHFWIEFDHRDRGDLKLATPGQRWDWESVGDKDRPGHNFCPVHRPGTGFDSEAEVKSFFDGRFFYWDGDLLYSFTK